MSQTPATREGTAVAVRPSDSFMAYLERRAAEDGLTRAHDIVKDQIDKLLTAETDDELWEADAAGTIAGQDICDVDLEIHGYKVVPSGSEYESTLGFYYLISATVLNQQESKLVETGDDVIINCGAALIMGKLRVFEARGKLPLRCKIRATKATNGNVLKLRPLPAATVATKTA